LRDGELPRRQTVASSDSLGNSKRIAFQLQRGGVESPRHEKPFALEQQVTLRSPGRGGREENVRVAAHQRPGLLRIARTELDRAVLFLSVPRKIDEVPPVGREEGPGWGVLC